MRTVAVGLMLLCLGAVAQAADLKLIPAPQQVDRLVGEGGKSGECAHESGEHD